MAWMTAWRPGRGQLQGELPELGNGFGQVIAEDAFEHSAGLLVRELPGTQREGEVHLSEGIECPPEVFYGIESFFPRHSGSPWSTSVYEQGSGPRAGWGDRLFRMAEHVRRWRRILSETHSSRVGEAVLLFSKIQAVFRLLKRELVALQSQAQRGAVQQVRGKGDEGLDLVGAEEDGLAGARREPRMPRKNGGEVAHGPEKGFLGKEHCGGPIRVGALQIPIGAPA